MRPTRFHTPFRPFFKPLLRLVIPAFFGAFALCNIGGFSPAGILSAVLFLLIHCFFSLCRKKEEARAEAEEA